MRPLVPPLSVAFVAACAPARPAFEESRDRDDTGGAPFEAVDEFSWRLHDTISSIVLVSWNQTIEGTGAVEFSVDKGEWRTTPVTAYAAGPNEAMLLGVPYDHDVTFRIVLDTPEGSSATEETVAHTDPLPVEILQGELVAADPSAWVPTDEWLLLSINAHGGGWTQGDYWKFIVDRQGRVVWAMITPDTHWTIYLRRSLDGAAILWDEATFWSDWDNGRKSKVHRMKIDGTVEETWETPGLHHAFTELPDGTLAWGAATSWSESLVELPPGDEEREIWSCTGDDPYADHCQSNSLWWNEATDSFLYSFYTSDSIFEIDRQSGQVVREWGHTEDSYAFDPPESAFWWQHGATITDTGTLLLSTHLTERSSELLVREYEIDDKARTLREVWSFGEGEKIEAGTAGEAHRLANGNTLHNFGSAGRVREITPGGDVVWDVAWEYNHLIGRSIFLDDLYSLAP